MPLSLCRRSVHNDPYLPIARVPVLRFLLPRSARDPGGDGVGIDAITHAVPGHGAASDSGSASHGANTEPFVLYRWLGYAVRDPQRDLGGEPTSSNELATDLRAEFPQRQCSRFRHVVLAGPAQPAVPVETASA